MKYYLVVTGVVLSSVGIGYSLGVYSQKRRDIPEKVTKQVAPAREFRHSDVNRPTPSTPEKPAKPVKKAPKPVKPVEEPADEAVEKKTDYSSISRSNKRVDNPDIFVDSDDFDDVDETVGERIQYITADEWESHPKGYGVLRLTYFADEEVVADNFGSILKEPLHSKLIGDTIEQIEIGRFEDEGAAFIRNNEVEKDIVVEYTYESYKAIHGEEVNLDV